VVKRGTHHSQQCSTETKNVWGWRPTSTTPHAFTMCTGTTLLMTDIFNIVFLRNIYYEDSSRVESDPVKLETSPMQHQIPEDLNLHQRPCENYISHISYQFCENNSQYQLKVECVTTQFSYFSVYINEPVCNVKITKGV